MFGKLKKLIADIETIYNLIQSHADELEKLKADIVALQPKKKVVKPTTKKTAK